MNEQVIRLWNTHKGKLEEFFTTHPIEEYDSYEKIVRLIITNVLNTDDDMGLNLSENIRVIDDGDYQGTILFLMHKKTYQPDETDYWITYSYYGSCSSCDTLMRIISHDQPKYRQLRIKELMTLALHLIQKLAQVSN